MKNVLIALGAVFGVILIIVLFCVGQYNSLVQSQIVVEQKAADIDTQLQRRADLIPNLVNTVKVIRTTKARSFLK